MVDADAAAQGNAGRFDELLACIGGAPVPDELAVDETALPLDRAMAARMEAELAAEDAREAEEGGEDREAAADAAYRDGHAEGEARWNAWFGGACAFVDALRGSPGGAPLEPAAHPTSSPPWTVSDVSTAALARALAEPVEGARRS